MSPAALAHYRTVLASALVAEAREHIAIANAYLALLHDRSAR